MSDRPQRRERVAQPAPEVGRRSRARRSMHGACASDPPPPGRARGRARTNTPTNSLTRTLTHSRTRARPGKRSWQQRTLISDAISASMRTSSTWPQAAAAAIGDVAFSATALESHVRRRARRRTGTLLAGRARARSTHAGAQASCWRGESARRRTLLLVPILPALRLCAV